MQTWKSVLNGLLVVAAAGGLYLYIDYATEPENMPSAHRDLDPESHIQRSTREGRLLSVAPAPLEGPATATTDP